MSFIFDIRYLLFFFAVTFQYFIPFSVLSKFPSFGLLAIVCTFLIVLKFLINDQIIKISDSFLYLTLALVCTINYSPGLMIHTIVIITASLLIYEERIPSLFEVRFTYYLLTLSIIAWIFIDGGLGLNGRLLINIPDPNFSSLLTMFYFFYCKKNNLKFGIIFSLFLVPFFSSRNYLISIVIFYFITFTKPYFFTKLFFKPLRKFMVWIILSLSFIVCVSFIYIANNPEWKTSKNNSARLSTFSDNSNTSRFMTNLFYFRESYKDKEFLLWGKGRYTVDYFTKSNPFGVVPHNSFLFFTAECGIIYFLFYALLLSKVIDNFFNFNNIEYIITYVFFALFLFATFQDFYLLVFLLILSIKSSKASNLERLVNV